MRIVSRMILRLESRAVGAGPIPLPLVSLARRFGIGEDALVPRLKSISTTGRALRNPVLRAALADHELGAWALGARTINWLEQQIMQLRPQLALEFGSGASTLCLAQFLVDTHGPATTLRVVSIDQDAAYAEETRELLRRNGLEAYVTVMSTTVRMQEIEGVVATCYDLPAALPDVLAGRRADFALIDGPAAEAGARFGTLPLARPYLSPNASFVLDDGFRDGEIWVARRWARLPGVRVDGILNIDKGLVVGHLTGG
jgi:hypothetical protein